MPLFPRRRNRRGGMAVERRRRGSPAPPRTVPARPGRAALRPPAALSPVLPALTPKLLCPATPPNRRSRRSLPRKG